MYDKIESSIVIFKKCVWIIHIKIYCSMMLYSIYSWEHFILPLSDMTRKPQINTWMNKQNNLLGKYLLTFIYTSMYLELIVMTI